MNEILKAPQSGFWKNLSILTLREHMPPMCKLKYVSLLKVMCLADNLFSEPQSPNSHSDRERACVTRIKEITHACAYSVSTIVL